MSNVPLKCHTFGPISVDGPMLPNTNDMPSLSNLIYTLGKMSVNASIFDKNQEDILFIKTNLWKSQLISLCRQREKKSEHALYIEIVHIDSNMEFFLWITEINFEKYFTNFTSTKDQNIQGMFDTIIDFTPTKFYVNLWPFMLFETTIL